MKKLETVSVTGGKDSSWACTSSADEPPAGSVALLPPPGPGPAHDDRLSFLSRDPFLVSELESPPTPPGLALLSCSNAAALDFLSKLLEAVESESESPCAEEPPSARPLVMFCSQMAVQANGMRYLPSRLHASYAFARTFSMLI